MTSAIDHRQLLMKYIYLVGRCEGTAFIERLRTAGMTGYELRKHFTDVEMAELETLDGESVRFGQEIKWAEYEDE